jgi:hypothetical protein
MLVGAYVVWDKRTWVIINRMIINHKSFPSRYLGKIDSVVRQALDAILAKLNFYEVDALVDTGNFLY